MKRLLTFFLAFNFSVILFAAMSVNGVKILETKNGSLNIQFKLPHYSLKMVNTKDGEFYKILCDDSGYMPEYGKAMLPTISFFVAIDGNKMPQVEIESFKKELVKLDLKVYPVQKPWPKSRRIEDRPFTIDSAYYLSNGESYPIVKLGKVFQIRDKKGVIVTISPFQYSPKNNTLTVFKEIKFVLKNVTPVFVSKKGYLSNIYSSVFLNAFKTNLKGKNEKEGLNNRILIISPADFLDTLQVLVEHKEALGYTVTLASLNDIGSSRDQIKNYIQQQYDNIDTRPDFVILVGDTNIIPEYVGQTEDNPHTDLYYSTLEGDDYFPDVALGRLSVTNVSQLQNIVNKIITMDNEIASYNKKASFVTADDNYQITEGTHNYVIANYFEPDGYVCDKLFYHTYGISATDISNAINDGRIFVVYSGHGDPTSWYISGGVSYTQSYIRSLQNTEYPFVLSFACLTGKYNYGECFGETWIRDENGACSFWGSSVYSYWDEDDILERNVFKAMFVDGVNQFGPMFNAGKLYLYSYYSGGGSTLRYFQQYNLLGDPSLYTAIYTPSSRGIIKLDKEVASCRGAVNIEVWDSDLNENSVDVTVVNLTTGETSTVTLNRIDDGKYSGQISFDQFNLDSSQFFEIDYHDENYGGQGDKTLTKEIYVDCDPPMPLYFNSKVIGSTGIVSIALNEKCSSGSLSIYKEGNSNPVAVLDLSGLDCGSLSLDNLDSDKKYYASFDLTDYAGNSFAQQNMLLFKAPEATNVFSDSCDSEDDNFTVQTLGGNVIDNAKWQIVSSDNAVSNGKCWYGKEYNQYNDSALVVGPISINGDCVLSFSHTFYTESGYDGCMVEISDDGGNTYTDAGALILQNGYNGTIEVSGDGLRQAFTGGSLGAMQTTIISLSNYEGKDIYIRFRVYSDPSVKMDNGGWYIDNIEVEQVNQEEYKSLLINLNKDTMISGITKKANALHFNLYDKDGVMVGEKTVDLQEFSAIHQRLSQIFSDIELDNAPYTLLCNSSEKVGLYEMDDFEDSRGKMRNWTEANTSLNSYSALVPHIAPEINFWDTFIQVASTESSSKFDLSFEPLNSLTSFSDASFNQYSSQNFDVIDTIFNNNWPSYNVGLSDVYAFNGDSLSQFCATEVFQVKDSDNSARLTLEQSIGNTLYVAHVDNSFYWWTGIAIVNPSSTQTATVDIIPYDKDGNQLDSGRVILNPGERYAFVTKDSFPTDSAWFTINSDTPLVGYELFGTMNRHLLTGLDLISRPSTEILLPVVDTADDWIGITVVNTAASSANITIECYLNGQKVFNKDFSLNSYAKWVGLLSDLYTGDVDMVRIVAPKGAVAFCLEGDKDMQKVGGVKGFIPY